MKEKLLKFLKGKNSPKLLFFIGLLGILLIFVSTLFPKEQTNPSKTPETAFTEEEYRAVLETDIRELVSGICGDTSPVVKITLETGIVYEYADEIKKNNAADSQKTSEESEKNYVTVKDQSGNELPLVITSHMPQIRGVAVICNAKNEDVVSKIEQAVCAALNISARKIYIGRKFE